MLNKRERYEALKFFKICCKLGPLPLDVDLGSWRIKASSTKKQCLCGMSFCFLVLHGVYECGSLAWTYLLLPDSQLHYLVIHTIMAMGSIMTAFWYYVLYIRSPELWATLVKITLLGNIGGSLDRSDQMKKEWKTRLEEYSLQDVLALSLPYLFVVSTLFLVALYIYDPSMTHLLYASLPTRLQNWATFGLCLVGEIRFIVAIFTIVVPTLQLQVISFDLVSIKLQLAMRTIQNRARTSRNVYGLLRCLQIYMSTLNNVHSYLVFTWKLVCISVSIISGYAAIAHFREHPVLGSLYYAVLFDGVFIYTVSYEKAFRIPQLFKQTASLAVMHMDEQSVGRTDVFRRQILSIPLTGIKVGNFHAMERASTLIFINYVLGNIVSMLVAYR